MSKVLIAVSGTGGHVYPGIAVAEELRQRRRDLQILFATARGKPGAEWIRDAGFEVRQVRLRGLSRQAGLSWLVFPFALVAGGLGALSLVLAEGPDLVVGTGGYVSGPFVAFAALLGIPTVILEQNLVPGVATRLGARWAREVHVAFPDTAAHLPERARVRVSGNPVRIGVERGDAAAFRAAHGLDDARPLVLVIGGSQGARVITETALEAARELGENARMQMLVQAGRRGVAEARARARSAPCWVRVVEFLPDMGGAYAAARLVVGRAGATTLAELAAVALPAILIPYPHAAADHQMVNARRYASGGGARVLPQEELDASVLAREIEQLLGDERELARMREAAKGAEGVGARRRVADACEALLG